MKRKLQKTIVSLKTMKCYLLYLSLALFSFTGVYGQYVYPEKESNNVEATASNIPYIPTELGSNSEMIYIQGNYETVDDVDYYKIIFPNGYNVSINASTYSGTTSKFSFKIGSGTWSIPSYYGSSNLFATPETLYLKLQNNTSGVGKYSAQITVYKSIRLRLSTTYIQLTSNLSQNTNVTVTSSKSWMASSNEPWIVLSNSNGELGSKELSIKTLKNDSTYARYGNVTIKSGIFTEFLYVYQPGKTGTSSVINTTPDGYEPNNKLTLPTLLTSSAFINDTATFQTNNATFHTVNDSDAYKIILPNGYNYVVDFSYTNLYYWNVDLYTTKIPYNSPTNQLVIAGGDTIKLLAKPYYTTIGIYSIKALVKRYANHFITLNANQDTIKINSKSGYPNFSLKSTVKFKIKCNQPWVNIYDSIGGVGLISKSFQTQENFETTERMAIITLTSEELAPITIVVRQDGKTLSDAYEPNDRKGQATSIPLTFTNDVATYLIDASIHENGNKDFYKIELPEGVGYKIKVKHLYKNNNGGNKKYNLDYNQFYYSIDNNPIQYFNNTDSVTIMGGRTFYLSTEYNYYLGYYGIEFTVARNVPVISVPSLFVFSGIAETKIMEVKANTAWAISNIPSWITITPTSGTGNASITLTSTANPTTNMQYGYLNFSGTNNTKYVNVYQHPMPLISVSDNALTIGDMQNSTSSFVVTTNTRWIASSSESWLDVKYPTQNDDPNNLNPGESGTVLLTAMANSGSARTAIVTVYSNGGAPQTVTVTQAAVSGNEFAATPQLLQINAIHNSSATFLVKSNGNWKALTNDYWISLSKISDNGSASVTVFASLNGNTNKRKGYITVYREGLPAQLITVVQDSIAYIPDNYENNNTEASAFKIPLTFTNGKAYYKTSGANKHTTTDEDYYKIVVPSDTFYRVHTKLYNIYNNYNIYAGLKLKINRGAWVTYQYYSSIDTKDLNPGDTLYYQLYDQYNYKGIYELSINVFKKAFVPTMSVSNSNLSFPIVPSSNKVVTVSANTKWTIDNSNSWLTVNPLSGENNGQLTISASENTGTDARGGYIYIYGGVATSIYVSQQGTQSKFINYSTDTLKFTSSPTTGLTFTINSNTDWSISSNSSDYTVSPTSGVGSGTITVTAKNNSYNYIKNSSLNIWGTEVNTQYLYIKQSAFSLSADGYETNDTEGAASTLPLNFTDNLAFVKTNGANIHVSNNVDFYKIVLPADIGATTTYTIIPRVQSTNGNDDGNYYTLPARFSYRIGAGGAYSSTSTSTVSNFMATSGQTIYFKAEASNGSGTGFYAFQSYIIKGATPTLSVASTTITMPNTPSSTVVFVNSNRPWTVSENYDWITVSPMSGNGSGTITITSTKNNYNASTVTGYVYLNSVTLPQVQINVLHSATTFLADVYEVNNTDIAATMLPLVFTNGAANYKLSSATLHVNSDVDIYKFVIPASSTISTVSTQLFNYNNNNGQAMFSSNAQYAYKIGKKATYNSSIYNFNANPGDTVYYRVSYVSLLGNYGLEINVSTAAPTFTLNPAYNISVEKAASSNTISVTSNTSWTALANNAVPWISISNAVGNQNGSFILNIEENVTSSNRSGSITFQSTGAGHTTFTVYQKGANEKALTVSTSTLNLASMPATNTFDITSNTNWYVSTDVPWLSFNPISGSNTMTVGVNATPNVFIENRTGNITISGVGVTDKTISVNQAGMILTADGYENNNTEGTASSLTVSMVNNVSIIKTAIASIHTKTDVDYYKITLPVGADTYTISSRLQDKYNRNDADYYSLDAKYSYKIGSGAWSVSNDYRHEAFTAVGGTTILFKVEPFTNPDSGTYRLNVKVLFGAPTLNISSSTINLSANANSQKLFDITSTTNWNISSIPSWLNISTVNGADSLGINGYVFTNSSTIARSASITITGVNVATKTVTINQAGAVIVNYLNVSKNALSLTAIDNGTSSFSIYSNTSWTVSSNQTWLTPSSLSGSNGDIINLSAASNSGNERTATITVTGGSFTRIITITQASSPEMSVSLNNMQLTADMNSGVFNITSNTSWYVTSNQSWLTLNIANGSLNGNVTVTAAANSNAMERTAVVTVSADGLPNKQINITQSGSNTISLSLTTSVSTIEFESSATNSSTFEVTSNVSSWTVSGDASWITISPVSGSNNGTIIVSTNSANTESANRTSTITVSGNGVASKTITVTQKGVGTTPPTTEPPTSIVLELNKTTFEVYPNPSNGLFTLQVDRITDSKLNVSIKNMAGKVVYSNVVSISNEKMNISMETNLQSGVYILECENKGKKYVTRLMIVK